MGSLLKFLSMMKVFSIYSHQFLEFYQEFVYWLWLGVEIDVFFVKNVEVVATIEFEKCVGDAYIFGIITGKLGYWKELSPIVLFIIDKNFEVCLHCTILPLGLAINLKMVGNKELLLDCQEVA